MEAFDDVDKNAAEKEEKAKKEKRELKKLYGIHDETDDEESDDPNVEEYLQKNEGDAKNASGPGNDNSA